MKLKPKKAVENETKTEKYFTTEITLLCQVNKNKIGDMHGQEIK